LMSGIPGCSLDVFFLQFLDGLTQQTCILVLKQY
jgi:hypothetical protein